MITNGIHGTTYHFFPGDLSDKLDSSVVEVGVNQIMSGNNAVHLFTGAMPDADELYAYDKVSTLLEDFEDNLVLSIGEADDDKFEINATYDKAAKERVLKKWPVNAKTYAAKSIGLIQWGVVVLAGITAVDSKDYMLFTDAIGTWDDPEVIIMLDKLLITKLDEEVEFKDFTYAASDVLAIDAVVGASPVTITFDEDSVYVGSSEINIGITTGTIGALDGRNATVTYTQVGAENGDVVTLVVSSDIAKLDLSTLNPNGLDVGDIILVNFAGTQAYKIVE